MIKEALQYILDLQKPTHERISGRDYYFEKDGTPHFIDICRKTESIKLSTLTSLVEYIRNGLDNCTFDFEIPGRKLIVHVVSEVEVNLITELNADVKRLNIINVRARVPQIRLNEFIDQEAFNIQMQSMFIDSEDNPNDKGIILQVAGNAVDNTVANYSDDGISQKTTIKAGIGTMEDVIVPNPVRLMPFRTFHEIEQPTIDFVFRMRNGAGGVSCALFEADGGAWKLQTVHRIAEYLKAALQEFENVVVMS